ncbi:TetR/AcrR family transcriptional regulator [Nonomuraea soli]|uniref:AcrR family transcriptional regulator n=1 Tax=Nonomuraea soli TaxID=1032476 RepID=A0A7W0CE02_9ACTN|nr:TetR/AcrR family transcriptional regulator [Nonomuraea soli]MBA2889423.1 AcrR family transcriptional regulator [Nonomuraea soli]
MPRHKGDHDARRREVSGAVRRVLAVHGFGGLTLRAVAAEMGATTGLLTHYFPSKRDLVAYALEVLDEQRTSRPRPAPDTGEGLAGVRAMLADILPTTAESVASNRVWVSSWDAALGDPELAAGHAARYRRSRERLQRHVEAAQERGEVAEGDAGEVAAALQSFVLGLIVQVLLEVDAFPPERQLRLLDDYLASLRP